jgi:hypothetical protein
MSGCPTRLRTAGFSVFVLVDTLSLQSVPQPSKCKPYVAPWIRDYSFNEESGGTGKLLLLLRYPKKPFYLNGLLKRPFKSFGTGRATIRLPLSIESFCNQARRGYKFASHPLKG